MDLTRANVGLLYSAMTRIDVTVSLSLHYIRTPVNNRTHPCRYRNQQLFIRYIRFTIRIVARCDNIEYPGSDPN